MDKTKNLFVLVGDSTDISHVVGTLQFKGLISIPYGITVDEELIAETFRNNKSLVCAADDISEELRSDAIYINVLRSTTGTSALVSPHIILANLPGVENQFETIAKGLRCDIGDHKSNSSGLNGTPTIADCVYCRYLAGDVGDNARLVYTSENFFVFPGSGQFAKGYLLVMPYAHVMSNGELDAEVLLTEFNEVLEDLKYLLKITYGKDIEDFTILVWENGSGNAGIGKAKDSIVHAHVHVIPSRLTSADIERISGFEFDRITLDQLMEYKENSYLLVREPDNEHWIINNNPKLYIPRQYLRQIVAEEKNVPGDLWNWRKYPFSENAHQCADDIQAAVESEWNSVPERVKQRVKVLVNPN